MPKREELEKLESKVDEVAYKQGNDPKKWDQSFITPETPLPPSLAGNNGIILPDMENPKFVAKRDPKAREEAMEELRRSVTHKIDRWADKIIISMYTPPTISRVEGEIWKEDGKTWTKKGGIKMTISSNQDARMPWWCPRCTKPMNHRFDRKFYYRKGMCYNCTIDWEGEMRRNGTYAAYERRTIRENEKSWLKDQIVEQMGKIKEFHLGSTVYHDGRYEDLIDQAAFKPMLDAAEKDIEILVRRLDAIAREELEEASQNVDNTEEHRNVDLDQPVQ